MGRKPLPTKLKLIKGTARPGRMVPNEPQPSPEMPVPPDHLAGHALSKWHELTPILFDLGLLTKVDRDPLVLYCEEYARYRDAQDEIAKDGMFIVTDKGNVIQHPAVGVVHKAIGIMHRLMVEFGMTPAARSKVSSSRKPDEADPFAEFK